MASNEITSIKKILIVGSANLCQTIEDLLIEESYETATTFDGMDAVQYLVNNKVDLVITSMNLPYLGGFALIQKIHDMNLNIPYIMLTASDISEYIGLACQFNVGYILSKAFKKIDFLQIIERLLDQEKLFGIQNYLNVDNSHIKTIDVRDSFQIQYQTEEVMNYAKEAGMPSEIQRGIRLTLDEMVYNALYHAHGYHDEKANRTQVILDGQSQQVKLQFSHDKDKFGATVTDYAGTLSVNIVLNTLKSFLENDAKLQNAIMNGEDPTPFLKDCGRGFQIVFETADEFYINIQPGKFTQITLLFWKSKYPEMNTGKSLKMTELSLTPSLTN